MKNSCEREEVFEVLRALSAGAHDNTIFAKFCEDQGRHFEENLPVPMIDMVWTKGAGKANTWVQKFLKLLHLIAAQKGSKTTSL